MKKWLIAGLIGMTIYMWMREKRRRILEVQYCDASKAAVASQIQLPKDTMSIGSE